MSEQVGFVQDSVDRVEDAYRSIDKRVQRLQKDLRARRKSIEKQVSSGRKSVERQIKARRTTIEKNLSWARRGFKSLNFVDAYPTRVVALDLARERWLDEWIVGHAGLDAIFSILPWD